MAIYFTIIGFILGSILGSGILALAQRSLTKKSFRGRSYCFNCRKQLYWYDLVPVFSYIILQGKCRFCRHQIGLEHLFLEMGVGILIAGLFFDMSARSPNFSNPYNYVSFLSELLFKTFFISVLLTMAITDFKKTIIPDRIILPATYISIIFLIVLTVFKAGYLYNYLDNNQIGRFLLSPQNGYFLRHVFYIALPTLEAILTGLLIGAFFFSLIIITRGKGMGGGDVKLGAFMGLGLGFPGGLLAVILAFITGALYALGLVFLGKKHFGQSIPFGPFLVLGSIMTLFLGDQIINLYLRLGY